MPALSNSEIPVYYYTQDQTHRITPLLLILPQLIPQASLNGYLHTQVVFQCHLPRCRLDLLRIF